MHVLYRMLQKASNIYIDLIKGLGNHPIKGGVIGLHDTIPHLLKMPADLLSNI
jgi:hypothetical protein